MKGGDKGRKRLKFKQKPKEKGSSRKFFSKVEMAAWTAGETSKQTQKERKRKKPDLPETTDSTNGAA